MAMGLICDVRAGFHSTRGVVVVATSPEVLVEVSGAVSEALWQLGLQVGSILFRGFVLSEGFLSSDMVN